MTSASFSVVIPAYNAAQTVGATIKSVLAQTEVDFELIVVDDGSTDETPEVVRSFESDSRVRLVEQPNQGTAGARNTGIGEARGTYVSFLDNDDLWMPGYLEVVGRTLEGAPDAGFAYADGWLIEDASKRVYRRTALEIAGAPAAPPVAPRDFLRRLVEGTFIRSATTVRRAVLEQVGVFDPDLSGVDDLDLWARILLAGHRAVQAPGMLLIFRDRPDSLSKDGLRMCRGRREVLQRIAESEDVPDEIRRAADAQLPHLDHLIDGITGQSGARALLLRGRRLLGSARRAVLDRARFLHEPPDELTAVFGDVQRL